MPPKRGGGARGRRKLVQGSDGATTTTTMNAAETPSVTTEIDSVNKLKSSFEITPLIVETDSITKVKLNHIIKNYMTDIKISNIQSNRPNSYILYPDDIKSFNTILNDLSSIIQTKENQHAVVYIPRSIQRVIEKNKEAYVKKLDLEIGEEEIKHALDEQGFRYHQVLRLINKEKTPLKTVKITFIDAQNRDLFVKLGLQIDSMHFISEPATQNNKPSQCYKCFKYGHVAKYCRSNNQICSRCGEGDHKYDNCPKFDQHPICCNCKGEHIAISTDCPKFKEHQRKIQKIIDQFSPTTKYNKISSVCPNWKDLEDFPTFQTTDKINKLPIIEIISEKIAAAVEQATEKIFQILNRKVELLISKFSNKFNIEVDEISMEKNDNIQKFQGNTNVTIQQRTPQEQPLKDVNNEIEYPLIAPNNGNKRKYISPSSKSDKLPTDL